MIAHYYNKHIDAEFSEEILDAVLLNLDNSLTSNQVTIQEKPLSHLSKSGMQFGE